MQHRCFACKHYAREDELVKCARTDCGNWFHATESCLSVKADTVLREYVCGHHHCHGCDAQPAPDDAAVNRRAAGAGRGLGDPGDGTEGPVAATDAVPPRPVPDGGRVRASSASGGVCGAALVQCFRCPTAFHSRCRPGDVHTLDATYFLCMLHVQVCPPPALPGALCRSYANQIGRAVEFASYQRLISAVRVALCGGARGVAWHRPTPPFPPYHSLCFAICSNQGLHNLYVRLSQPYAVLASCHPCGGPAALWFIVARHAVQANLHLAPAGWVTQPRQ